ncbi:hypothetical protein BDR03DRAFT_98615 [Suillus americanus]|nr:hypothetical protein BDR03DRAFT_98615 [Suillus americanus]
MILYLLSDSNIAQVIIITRLHAMYQRSKKMHIFLVVTYLAVTIACVVIAIISLKHISGEELVFSGTYQCIIILGEGAALLMATIWILTTAWEILALCLAVCIAVKHFRELRKTSSGGIIEDCFTVLIKTHLIYFTSFVVVSCLSLTALTDSSDVGVETYSGLRQFCLVMQMFVLGPRLIFSVRKHHAKLTVNSDEGSSMTSIAFQEVVHVSTGSNVQSGRRSM